VIHHALQETVLNAVVFFGLAIALVNSANALGIKHPLKPKVATNVKDR
jgi:hypothetical protein